MNQGKDEKKKKTILENGKSENEVNRSRWKMKRMEEPGWFAGCRQKGQRKAPKRQEKKLEKIYIYSVSNADNQIVNPSPNLVKN